MLSRFTIKHFHSFNTDLKTWTLANIKIKDSSFLRYLYLKIKRWLKKRKILKNITSMDMTSRNWIIFNLARRFHKVSESTTWKIHLNT